MEELKGRKAFKVFAIVAIIVGGLITVIGMFMLGIAINADPMDYSQEVIFAQRMFTLGSVYVLSCGIFFCYSGFFGVSNWNVECEIKKQFILGCILLGFVAVDIVLLFIVMKAVTVFNVLCAVLPLIAAVGYFTCSFMDYKVLKMEEGNE